MMIPNLITGVSDNMLRNYGTMSLDCITAHEKSYINLSTREAQDTNLLYECLMNSLDPDARAKVIIWRDDYWCTDLPSGNLILKIIIRECHLDTNATIAGIRNRLSSLDSYISTVDYDIRKFNMYVKSLIRQLGSRGQRSNDLLINLFEGYISAADKRFITYIDKIWNSTRKEQR